MELGWPSIGGFGKRNKPLKVRMSSLSSSCYRISLQPMNWRWNKWVLQVSQSSLWHALVGTWQRVNVLYRYFHKIFIPLCPHWPYVYHHLFLNFTSSPLQICSLIKWIHFAVTARRAISLYLYLAIKDYGWRALNSKIDTSKVLELMKCRKLGH